MIKTKKWSKADGCLLSRAGDTFDLKTRSVENHFVRDEFVAIWWCTCRFNRMANVGTTRSGSHVTCMLAPDVCHEDDHLLRLLSADGTRQGACAPIQSMARVPFKFLCAQLHSVKQCSGAPFTSSVSRLIRNSSRFSWKKGPLVTSSGVKLNYKN